MITESSSNTLSDKLTVDLGNLFETSFLISDFPTVPVLMMLSKVWPLPKSWLSESHTMPTKLSPKRAIILKESQIRTISIPQSVLLMLKTQGNSKQITNYPTTHPYRNCSVVRQSVLKVRLSRKASHPRLAPLRFPRLQDPSPVDYFEATNF